MRRPSSSVLAVRQQDAAGAGVPQCSGWGTDLGDKSLRIASVFIILVGSLLGVFLPMALARIASPHARSAKLAFFVCKYFGSGVILATAFMHLLSPAVEALSDDCLGRLLPDYDWGHAICLMTIMVMFYIELMAARFNFSFGHAAHGDAHSHGLALGGHPEHGHGHGHGHGHEHGHGHGHGHGHSHSHSPSQNQRLAHLGDSQKASPRLSAASPASGMTEWRAGAGGSSSALGSDLLPSSDIHGSDVETAASGHVSLDSVARAKRERDLLPVGGLSAGSGPLPEAAAGGHHQPHHGGLPSNINYPPGNEDHLAHGREHVPGDSHASYSSQIVSLLILEFGVVFHSLFIGLSLAGSDNLRVLLIVIAFHQFFEGLGLGSRLAVAAWPSSWTAWTGYLMALGYGVTTPVGIAIGLGVNAGLNAHPDRAQLVNGVFDAVSAGILIYTALVELLAHEFMFNPEMRDAKLRVQMLAFACVAVGVAVMAVLAKWA